MTWKLTIDGTDRTSIVDRTSLRVVGAADYGQAEQGGFDLADDAATVGMPGRKVWTFTEGTTILERGRIHVKEVNRGTRFTGDARQYGTALVDANSELDWIIVDQWSRPAETDVARVLALIADYLNGADSNSSFARASTTIGSAWVRDANTLTLDAQKYEATSPHDVLQEIADMSGKNYFVIVNADGTMDLFYDVDDYVGYASSLSITDDEASVNDTTVFAPQWADGDPLEEDPSELVSGLLEIYGESNTRLYRTRPVVYDEFDKFEAAFFANDAKSFNEASTLMTNRLNQQSIEQKTYRCAIQVPTSVVAANARSGAAR
jgi:hypothetical protein